MDETSYVVQRSPDGTNWSTIATLSSNSTSHADNGLAASTTYHYRVFAQNGAGSSGYSNVATESTDPLPAVVDDRATADIALRGAVSGTYLNTHFDDGTVQTITETSTGGAPSKRKQSYTHGWTFEVDGGAGGVVLTANAWISGGEGARFEYSVDNGTTWTFMFTVDSSVTSSVSTFNLPPATAGPVRVQAVDASQIAGESADSLFVDHLLIQSFTQPGNPPAAPSNLQVMGSTSLSVALSFTDGSGDEFGFEILRASPAASSTCALATIVGTAGADTGTGGTVAWNDTTVTPRPRTTTGSGRSMTRAPAPVPVRCR